MASPLNAHEELARLIAEQARDDAQRRIRGTHESDLAPADDPGRLVFDGLADPRADDPAEIVAAADEVDLVDPSARAAYRRRVRSLLGPTLLGLSAPWQAPELHYTGGPAPCPIHGPELPRGSICLVCSRSYEDPRPHPMAGTPTRPTRKARKARKATSKATPIPVELELAGGLGPARPMAV